MGIANEKDENKKFENLSNPRVMPNHIPGDVHLRTSVVNFFKNDYFEHNQSSPRNLRRIF